MLVLATDSLPEQLQRRIHDSIKVIQVRLVIRLMSVILLNSIIILQLERQEASVHFLRGPE